MTRGPSPKPLPPELRSSAFTHADARAAGVSATRLRAADLEHRVRGVRGASGSADDLLGRCKLFARRLPVDAFFSHQTAALLLGAPLDWREERATALHVTVPAPRRAPHAAGLVGHSYLVLEGDVATARGLRVSSPARMWCELGVALDLLDLVAVGDFVIHHRLPLVSTAQLHHRASRGDRAARSKQLPVALALLSDRSESRRESHLRVILELGGLPRPDINHVVVSTEKGRAIRTDFGYPEWRVAIEYQGDYHRDRKQWRDDMTRRSRLEAKGWYVLEINAEDLKNPAELCERVWTILRRQGHPASRAAR